MNFLITARQLGIKSVRPSSVGDIVWVNALPGYDWHVATGYDWHVATGYDWHVATGYDVSHHLRSLNN